MNKKNQKLIEFFQIFQKEIVSKKEEFKTIQSVTQQQIILENLIIVTIVIIALAVFVAINSFPRFISTIIGMLIIIFTKFIIESSINYKKEVVLKYYKRFKDKYFNDCLLTPFDGLEYKPDKKTKIKLSSLNPSIMFYNLFLEAPPNYLDTDDVFKGVYKNLSFELIEADIGYEANNSTQRIYHGVFLHFQLYKDIKAKTIIVPKGSLNLWDLSDRQNLEEVKLESPDFNDQYSVYSQDQVECRYLLTPSFMQRFMTLKNAFSSESLKAYFNSADNSLIIIIPIKNRNLFEIVSLWKPLEYSREKAMELYSELISIYDILEALEMYKNIKL